MSDEKLEELARAAIADCAMYRPPVEWNEEALSGGDEASIPGVAYEMRDTIAAFIAAANPATVLKLLVRVRATEAVCHRLAGRYCEEESQRTGRDRNRVCSREDCDVCMARRVVKAADGH
jgi:hypothetical protein